MRVIGKIETFRSKEGRLPADLKEIHEPLDESAVQYQMEKGGEYSVWFGGRLGESILYRSNERSWSTGG